MTAMPIMLGPTRHLSAERPVRVALVCMPWAALERPSIQIGLLAAIARSHGHTAETFHLNLEFAHDLGAIAGELARWQYDTLSSQRHVSGDWFFAAAAFDDDAPPATLLLEHALAERRAQRDDTDELVAHLMKVREHLVPAYLDRMVELTDWSRFDVVGFSSTFQQTAAAIALARRIKARWPHVITLFGGANFDSPMGREWVRGCSTIDVAIQGEADVSFPRFLDAVSAGQDPIGIPGVITRREDDAADVPPMPVESIDRNPIPDYREYFERMQTLRLIPHHHLGIPYESARGCWWGAKRHCTFCGLNGETMAFRSKPPATVLDELANQALEHRVLRFEAVDNIMEVDYLETLLPALAARNRPFSLFYELKADLDRQQIQLLAEAGVDRVQPGIESLDSRVLGLMRKGTRAVWNVNFLRWSRYYGISVAWNVLWGFPGERADDVGRHAASLSLLHHLEPPGAASRIWLERFSPLFRERVDSSGGRVTPERSYSLTFPEHFDLDELAYFFEYEFDDALPDDAYAPLAAAVDEWRRAADEAPRSLLVDDLDDHLVIRDRRGQAPETVHVVDGLAAAVHRQVMERWATPAQIADALGEDPTEVTTAVEDLVRRRLLFPDGKLVLALALPAERAPVRGRVTELPDVWSPAPS